MASVWHGGHTVALVLVVLVGPGNVAVAQEANDDEGLSLEELRSRFEAAERHYADGDLALALNEFRVVHGGLTRLRHANASLVLFNIARCFAGLGRDEEAADAYERFLGQAPETAPFRDEARQELRELEARAALDTADPESERPVRAEAFAPIGFVVAAVGGAALIAGAVTGGLALGAEADATADCVAGHCPPELGSRADEAHLLANVTDGLLFGGLAVAALGVVLAFTLSTDSGDMETASISCSADGCSVQIGGRF